MKIAKPPIFLPLHASTMVNVAAEKKPPCLIVCVDPSTGMIAIATVIEAGIVHWTITGPTQPDEVKTITEKFQTDMGLESDSVHFFMFDSTQIVEHSAANNQQN